MIEVERILPEQAYKYGGNNKEIQDFYDFLFLGMPMEEFFRQLKKEQEERKNKK